MVIRRPGHSLPELIVTVTFLGVGLTGVAGSSILGARWATDALRAQEAVRLATAVLDSLAASDAVGSDAVERGGLRARWEAGTREIRVIVEDPAGLQIFEIQGRRLPRVPVLPDVSGAAP